MNILVVNDDGIDSPGIAALVKALSTRADVYVFAPADQQSAKSQSLTLRKEIYADFIDFPYAKKACKVKGTPADCTKLGLQLCKADGIKIDMVYTGINLGSNLGKDTVYSGTVGAAMEAAMDGYQAVAVSVDSHHAHIFDGACELALQVMDYVYGKVPASTVINLNVPHVPKEEIKGVKLTVLGPRYYDDEFKLQDNGGYVLEGGDPVFDHTDESWDIGANDRGYASITPLSFDYTDEHNLDLLKDWSFTI